MLIGHQERYTHRRPETALRQGDAYWIFGDQDNSRNGHFLGPKQLRPLRAIARLQMRMAVRA